MKKYELTNESITYEGYTLYIIKALKDFGNVKKGDLGGFIQSESNLSQEGNCWVYPDTKVYGNAKVYENARVFDRAKVSGDAQVYGDAEVYENAVVYENAWVSGNAWVYGDAEVFGNAWVSGDARVYENAKVSGDARVFGDAEVCGTAWVYGKAWVYKTAKVYGNAKVYENALASGDAGVFNIKDRKQEKTPTEVELEIGEVDNGMLINLTTAKQKHTLIYDGHAADTPEEEAYKMTEFLYDVMWYMGFKNKNHSTVPDNIHIHTTAGRKHDQLRLKYWVLETYGELLSDEALLKIDEYIEQQIEQYLESQIK